MHPVLFGSFNTYGTLILIGGLVAMPCAYWDIKARGLAPGRAGSMLVDLYLVLVFGAAIGGRIFHVLTAPGSYLDDPSRMFAADGTGFVFFGSLFAIAAGMVWLARRYDTRFAVVLDTAATWMPLAHVFGRLGCWFAGCCWGAASHGWSAVQFPAESVAYLSGEVAHAGDQTIAVHPTQLYEATGLAICFFILLAARLRRGVEAPWRQASRYAVCYGMLRMITEVFRGDASRGYLFEVGGGALGRWLALPPDHAIALSFSQAVGLGLVVVGLVGLRRTRR